MTHFLRDILRQPNELQRTFDFVLGAGQPALHAATAAIRGARHVYLTGISISWHAALGAAPLFHRGARPVYLQDAAELLQFAAVAPDSALIVISSSGRSVEIVNLLAKVHDSSVTVIGITDSEDGPLAKESRISIVVPIQSELRLGRKDRDWSR
jgi:glucosamine--fructose-6-phosphate aminotransferase (isomerizing)